MPETPNKGTAILVCEPFRHCAAVDRLPSTTPIRVLIPDSRLPSGDLPARRSWPGVLVGVDQIAIARTRNEECNTTKKLIAVKIPNQFIARDTLINGQRET
jgi:hypothetical protein